MGHGPATKWKEDKSSAYKARLGVWMFFGYVIIYVGFILINVLNPKLMSTKIWTLNLALVYGWGLIIFALILAMIYNHMCTKAEKRFNEEKEDK